MKKIVAYVLTLLLVILNVTGVMGASVEPYYLGTGRATAGLSISSSGNALCTVTVNITKPLEDAYIVMTLWQHSSNGWVEVQSWHDDYSTATGGYIRLSGNKSLSQSGIYQVTSNIEVTTTAGTDNLYVESSRVNYNG